MPRQSHNPQDPDATNPAEAAFEAKTRVNQSETLYDLLLQIYESLGIRYDEMTGEYRVLP